MPEETMKIRFSFDCNHVQGADREEIFEYPVGTSEEEIQGDLSDWVLQFADWGFSKVEEAADA